MKFFCIPVLCFCLLGAVPVKPAAAPAPDARPAAQGQDSIRLPTTVRCGETVHLRVLLPEGPAGAFPTVGVNWLQRPKGKAPDVLPGVPETDIIFHVPGQYRCRVRVGHMIKGS